jgi:hypothetical protein
MLPSFLSFLSYLCFPLFFKKQRCSLSLFLFQRKVKDKVTPLISKGHRILLEGILSVICILDVYKETAAS